MKVAWIVILALVASEAYAKKSKPRTLVRVDSKPEALILVDGIVSGKSGDWISVSGGKVKLLLKAPGYKPKAIAVRPPKGQASRYAVTLTKTAAPPPPPARAKTASPKAKKKAEDPAGMFSDPEPDYAKNRARYEKIAQKKRLIRQKKQRMAAIKRKNQLIRQEIAFEKAQKEKKAEEAQKRRKLAALRMKKKQLALKKAEQDEARRQAALKEQRALARQQRAHPPAQMREPSPVIPHREPLPQRRVRTVYYPVLVYEDAPPPPHPALPAGQLVMPLYEQELLGPPERYESNYEPHRDPHLPIGIATPLAPQR